MYWRFGSQKQPYLPWLLLLTKKRGIDMYFQWFFDGTLQDLAKTLVFTQFSPCCEQQFFKQKLRTHCRRKFRSQTSDNMDTWKADVVRVKEEKRRAAERRSEKRKSQKKEDAGARKGRKVAKVFIQWFEAPEGRKVGLLKRRVRSQLARWEMKNRTPLWVEAHFEVKMYKTHHSRTTLGNWDVKKVHAIVARSTFRSQNVQNTPCSDHFWKLTCRKSARRCGAKHVSKSKCTKHTMFGPLLAVELSKKCTPLWCAAHVEVKMYNTLQLRNTFGSCSVEKVHTVVAQSTCRSQNVKKGTCSRHFWTFRCRFAWQAQGIVDLVKSDQNVRVL